MKIWRFIRIRLNPVSENRPMNIFTCACSKHRDPLKTMANIRSRCAAESEIAATLRVVTVGDWRSVSRCTECGSLWAQEYPFGEHHGGGPPCSYQIETDDPDKWLRQAPYLTQVIRQRDEDRAFYEALGPEICPEPCHHNGCNRKRIRNSVHCRTHHFEMIRKRPSPDEGTR